MTEVRDLVWPLRHDLPGGRTAPLLSPAHASEPSRTQAPCPQGDRLCTARSVVARTVETLGGPVQFERPYCYCRLCRRGSYPCDEVLNVAPGRLQLDVPQAAAQPVLERPDEEAHTFFHALTGVRRGAERLPTLTKHVAQGRPVLEVAPAREEMAKRIAAGAAGQWRRPVVGLGMDGACVPTRPESARGRRPGQRCQRAKRPQGKGAWRDATGCRLDLMEEGRIVPLLRWHQVQDEAEVGDALPPLTQAGLIPEEQGRLCVGCDGASWRGQPVHALFPEARQVLD